MISVSPAPPFSDQRGERPTQSNLLTRRTEAFSPPQLLLGPASVVHCSGLMSRFPYYKFSTGFRPPICNRDLLQVLQLSPPLYNPSPLNSMCFGIRATVPLLLWCLRRISKLLTASPMYSHLTVLDNHAGAHPNTPAFKLPRISTHGGPSPSVQAWIPVSYRGFRDDVEHFARYWMATFQRSGIKPRSCIGIWWVSTSRALLGNYLLQLFTFHASYLGRWNRIDGTTYQDMLHVLGVSRAGYIPQLLHFHRGSAMSLIIGLLRHANACALICDASHAQLNRDPSSPFASLPIPVYPNLDLRQAGVPSHCRLPKIEDLVADQNAIAFVLHTAGTTLGTPKLVPYTHLAIDSIMRRARVIAAPTSSRCQDKCILK